MKFQLTNDQQEAYDYLVDEFPNEPVGTIVLLTGAAGTGKTTLQIEVLKAWMREMKQISLSALTHKAAGVVRAMVNENELAIGVNTIHSTLKLALKKNNSTGEYYLVQSTRPDLAFNSILTIDEGSMMNDEVWEYVKDAALQLGLRVLVIGDLNQLPPVNQVHKDGSPRMATIFSDLDVKKLELKETVRQPGASPIVDLARSFITSSEMPRMAKFIENEHGRVELLNHTQLMQRAKDLVIEARDLNDPNHVIVLAHKNASVINYNDKLRQHVWGDVDPFQPGERLIVNEQTNARDADDLKVDLLNNEIVVVESKEPNQLYGLDGFDVTFEDGRTAFAPLDTMHLLALKRAAVRDKNWPAHFGYKEQVADLRNAYAVTVHKSQSSTYTHVLIDMGDIHAGNDAVMLQKLCYTAMTRASKSVSLAGYEVFWQQPAVAFAS